MAGRKKGKNNKDKKIKEKCIYFFLEGNKDCSEHKYIKEYYNQLRELKGKAINIKFNFIPCGNGSWTNIEKEIKKEKIKEKIKENDEVWCVLDKDRNDLDKIYKICKGNNYSFIYSNNSFEIWLLFHYENIKVTDCNQKYYERCLSKKIGKEYDKCKGIKFSYEEKERAIKKSKRKDNNYDNDEKSFNNRLNTTNFYMILEKFKEVFYNFDLE